MVNRDASPTAERERLWEELARVSDPEIPHVSIVDLGIVRDVEIEGARCTVTLTPTYSGCPATDVITQSVRDAVALAGYPDVRVATRLVPAWTTDWITERGRKALANAGIAAPVGSAVIDTSALSARTARPVPCPLCGSPRTRLLAHFGSTACKALYRCDVCLEPFDYFKPH